MVINNILYTYPHNPSFQHSLQFMSSLKTYDTSLNCNFTSYSIPSSLLIEEYENTEHTYSKRLNLCNYCYIHITKGDVYTRNYVLYSPTYKGYYLPCYEYIKHINNVHIVYLIMFILVSIINLFIYIWIICLWHLPNDYLWVCELYI